MTPCLLCPIPSACQLVGECARRAPTARRCPIDGEECWCDDGACTAAVRGAGATPTNLAELVSDPED